MGHLSKAFLRLVRPRWEALTSRLIGMFQFGMGPDAGIGVPAHALRCWRNHSNHHGYSWAAIFVDLSGAYDHTVRERLFEVKGSLQSRLESAGLAAEVSHEIIGQLDGSSPLLSRAGVPRELQDVLLSSLDQTWVKQRGSGSAVRTKVGVRQGDPMASSLFVVDHLSLIHI
eukprot:4199576-Alexandrium_andersonii.AAC.1